MGQVLSETDIKAFRDDGFLTPFDVYSEDDAAVLGAARAFETARPWADRRPPEAPG